MNRNPLLALVAMVFIVGCGKEKVEPAAEPAAQVSAIEMVC